MKRCNNCQSFSRRNGIGWCEMREATPQPWLAETCGDYRPGCDRCAELEACIREVLDTKEDKSLGWFWLENALKGDFER